MRLFRIISVSVLVAVLCLVLAWGTVVIVHAGPQETASGIEPFPAAAGVPAAEPAATGAPPPPSAVQLDTDTAAVGGEDIDPAEGIPFSSRRRIGSDPLKEVTELGKATANQLQGGDRYLESKTRRLAEQYAKAKDWEAQTKLRGELAQTIKRHFDVRHEIRKREIAQLEARVRKLREHLQKREGARQTIVEMRLNQFISAAEGLGWDTDFGKRPPTLRNPLSGRDLRLDDPFGRTVDPARGRQDASSNIVY